MTTDREKLLEEALERAESTFYATKANPAAVAILQADNKLLATALREDGEKIRGLERELAAAIEERDTQAARVRELEARLEASIEDDDFIDKVMDATPEQLDAITLKQMRDDGTTLLSLSERLTRRVIRCAELEVERNALQEQLAEARTALEACVESLKFAGEHVAALEPKGKYSSGGRWHQWTHPANSIRMAKRILDAARARAAEGNE